MADAEPQPLRPFSGFAVDDVPAAHRFYRDVLDLATSRAGEQLWLHLPGGADVLVYPRADHAPAGYTVLNFPVEDIDAAVDRLVGRGVTFERFAGYDTDERGVYRGVDRGDGPLIAWFRDPAGNILSILQETP